MTCKWLITILRTKPEKNAPFQLAPATRWAPFFVINPTKTVPFIGATTQLITILGAHFIVGE